MQAKDGVGAFGERVAARHVAGLGWALLDRNWRGAGGELDLVARDGGTVVFIEVKTRSGLGYGHPAEAVTRRKLGRVRRLAAQWLAAHGGAGGADVRIDVIAVVRARRGRATVEHLVGVS